MPKSLEKARKHIAKKRNGTVDALHLYSRDSKRLHRASLRDQKLEKLAGARSKKEQPLLDRAAFFQAASREKGTAPLELDAIQELIKAYVHQYDEEYDSVKKTRRSGRPPSVREDLLKLKIEGLETEHKNGFFVPDLTKDENVQLLGRWEGSWAYLSSVAWVRISGEGIVKASGFPPQGAN